MEPIYSEFICAKCIHKNTFEPGCKAFPDGIPDEILASIIENADHSKPFPGQKNDIVFEPIKPDKA